ncbi:S-layer homology domain-containing protein [Gloeocapsopsis crepidinum LEGE 06123]|uniref:S-layer homology domain-containing protein n=1 Tax=Gloeocapsopsis crepidinum LEGE 06123 TaxID=588587 RepID=A0ABR9US77_9CHRO|nr:S-layer homology domain-containing protein [Gloeocapsopsis crepidinum]MBE9191145.1 S-layer homology domain-containing protein [Gloeocapsopsis crepidinum LEGE 06123]
MSTFTHWQSGTAGLMALGITVGAVAPTIAPAPSFAQASAFADVPANYWASPFIAELASRNIIAGFPDGGFRPEEPVTRAQFAAMVSRAFPRAGQRPAVQFTDVPGNYWGAAAIQQAYTTGFLAGYPGNRFEPNQNIPREQVLVSLANGLNYTASADANTVLSQFYGDANAISSYARAPIAAATERRIVVNYPNVQFLNPTQTATRADVAAFIYQALASAGQVAAVNSPYVVGQVQQPTTPATVTIPSGTSLPVRYDQAERILVTRDETAPLTLTVAQNIITQNGTVLIPSGSQVVGELRPAEGGSQFVARELVLANGQRSQFDATSEVITRTERVRRGANAGRIVRNAALGAAAAAAISAVTGDRAIATEEVLGGAGVGALLGLFLGRDSVDLVAIDPDTDLQLTLGSDLVLTPGSTQQQPQ